MGREKRIAESRVKQAPAENRREPEPAEGAPASFTPSAPAPAEPETTGTAKAILEIVGLYVIPVILIIVIGKIFLHP